MLYIHTHTPPYMYTYVCVAHISIVLHDRKGQLSLYEAKSMFIDN